MRRSLNYVLFLLSITFLYSCASKSEMKAQTFYEEAQAHFQRGEYEQTISKITRAFELTDGGKQTFTRKFYFFNGTIRHLRGQAHEALGRNQEALEDYSIAITQGNEFLSSYALNSDPEPYAKRKFKRNNLAKYYESRARLYRKLEKSKLAADDSAQASRWSVTD